MKNKLNVSIMTSISALLFCIFIISGSLSPLSLMGDSANQFNSLGMWLSIGMILTFYVIPLFLYLIGLDWMKHIMSFLCAIGILIFVTSFFTILMIGIVMNVISSLSIVIATCILAIIVNIIWFIIAYKQKPSESKAIV